MGFTAALVRAAARTPRRLGLRTTCRDLRSLINEALTYTP
jgi:hypothetical protein